MMVFASSPSLPNFPGAGAGFVVSNTNQKESQVENIEAGDPRYGGFRITELWALVGVDSLDDQEGIHVYMGQPLIATDERRLVSLKELLEKFQAQDSQAQIKHFRLVEE